MNQAFVDAIFEKCILHLLLGMVHIFELLVKRSIICFIWPGAACN